MPQDAMLGSNKTTAARHQYSAVLALSCPDGEGRPRTDCTTDTESSPVAPSATCREIKGALGDDTQRRSVDTPLTTGEQAVNAGTSKTSS